MSYGFDGVFNNLFANTLDGVSSTTFSALTVDGTLQILEYFNSPTDYSELQFSSTPGGPYNIQIQPNTVPRNISITAPQIIINGTLLMEGLITSVQGITAGNFQFNTTACRMFSNHGQPGNALGSNGDFSFSPDGGSLQTIFQKRNGTWVGIV